METLTDITTAETTRRIRARDYEEAKNRVENLQRKVDKLSSSKDADTVARLRRIIEDATALPEDVIGSVAGLIPISGVVRTFISALASSALAGVERKDEQRRAQLDAAQAELDAAAIVLATFTK